MVVLDLKKNSGLSLSFNGEELMLQESGLSMNSKEVITIDDIRPQLLNPELTCPEVFYFHFRGIDRKSLLKKKKLKFDILIIPSNLAGIEYVKTRTYTIGNYPILLDVVNGFLTILVMNNLLSPDPESVVESSVVKLKKGDKYVIPPNSSFVLANTRQPLCVVTMVYCDKLRFNYCCDDSRGASNYLIRKNARQEIVQNPSFRFVKKIRMPRPENIYKEFNLTAKTPIFKQILRKYQRFKWLHDSDLMDWDKLLKQ
ncbi:MAG: glucose-6-phosphate isomerase family protein [bacterium]